MLRLSAKTRNLLVIAFLVFVILYNLSDSSGEEMEITETTRIVGTEDKPATVASGGTSGNASGSASGSVSAVSTAGSEVRKVGGLPEVAPQDPFNLREPLVVEPAPAGDVSGNATGGASSDIATFELVGIIQGQTSSAIFKRGTSEIALMVGEEQQGLSLVEVGRDYAVISDNGATKTLYLK